MSTVLITGVSQGLGRQLVQHFAERGARVLGVGLAADPRSPYLDRYETVDMGALEGVPSIAAGGVDVLVNNAAVYLDDPRRGYGNALRLERADLLRTYEVNIVGPTMLSTALALGMLERGYGRIINVSSGMGRLKDADGSAFAYRSSKLALNHLTMTLSALFHKDSGDLSAFSYCPGWISTAMGLPDAPSGAGPAAAALAALAEESAAVTNGRFFRHHVELGWDL